MGILASSLDLIDQPTVAEEVAGDIATGGQPHCQEQTHAQGPLSRGIRMQLQVWEGRAQKADQGPQAETSESQDAHLGIRLQGMPADLDQAACLLAHRNLALRALQVRSYSANRLSPPSCMSWTSRQMTCLYVADDMQTLLECCPSKKFCEIHHHRAA